MNLRSIAIEWDLLAPVFVLLVFSLTTLFFIHPQYFSSQLTFTCIALVFFFLFSHVNYKIAQLHSARVYAISIVLLLLLFVVGIESRGAVRWIELFGLRVQFSEILKPFLALAFSSFIIKKENTSFKTFLLALIFIFPLVLLISLQPDLGNAIIYAAVSVATLVSVGFPWKFFLGGFAGITALLPILWNVILRDYQKERIATFINPYSDPLGTSYNVIQSMIAVGSGMIAGKGISEATQSRLRFLPERHTDFIFASFSEGFGLIGALCMIAAFCFLLYRIFRIIQDSSEPFCKIFATVAFFSILIPFFINIGMNIGIMPVTGITLPFVSYGGSSLVSNFIFLGLLSSVKKSIKEEMLEIK
ncbi:MAG: hypothetical protein A2698_01900 [Candidatus Levybacteria bacterium RIFCSPHIGHO2_01_FULL_42_15]|nr:MAG: hypothetical protein A2698_01900 [Candidatus Levybacteria bacterium RIFCSPHIGHO2_01_FULL_42_15]OGH41990.1 MAG: hypothetical protein A3B53_00580 [Candidatus Levybacteria bacterium RIFCSPLOWO2_01_FULL_42_15]